ncbi:hypothetical protein [Pseudomonas sp. p1(2021b)]|uniref:hypothetical protein n=1 Tax=Pseudomonas sp. p1(2021b) TaxID=2874628 RepID=UPI003D2AFC01
MRVKLDLRKLAAVERRLKKLEREKVEVGFFEEDKYEDGTPVAEVAFYNEYGTSLNPRRPFMAPLLEDKPLHAAITYNYALAMQDAISGKGRVKKWLELIGGLMQEQIQENIEDYPGHNSPDTIRRKGFDDPLRDTGRMHDSVKVRV